MAVRPETLLDPSRIIDVKATDKTGALNEMIDVLATSKLVTDKRELAEKIFEREKAASTGVGSGIAIPHVKIASIKDFVAAVGRSRAGLDFESLDGAPTHIIVMIGCNNTQLADFLKVLARLVTKLRQPDLQKKILEAGTPAEVHELFAGANGAFG